MKGGYQVGNLKISSDTWRKRYCRLNEIISVIKKKRSGGKKRRRLAKKLDKIRGDWSINQLSNRLADLRKSEERFKWKRSQLE